MSKATDADSILRGFFFCGHCAQGQINLVT
jgi:aerobic-type carbon monoxide dehydrogenase small subunit (CoxS/CutS family)